MRTVRLGLLAAALLTSGFVAATAARSTPPCWAGHGGDKTCATTTTTTTEPTTTTTPTTTTMPTTTTTPTTTTVQQSPSYIFDDEFNGAAGSAPNPALWEVTPWCSSSADDQEFCYNTRNAFLDGNGNLILRVSAGTMGRPYDGARIQTFVEGSWPPTKVLASVSPPVRIEVRAKFAPGAGVWGGIWANGVTNFPGYAEYDIQEFRGAVPTIDTCHTHGWNGLSLEGGATIDTGTDLSSGWHVYWADYYADHIIYGIDSMTCGDLPAVNQPIGIRLDNVVGLPGTWGGQGGPPPASDIPADMEVDYVRVTAIG